jgi:hypothetical protein
MAIYITQIEKYKFVCGLFWQSLSRPRELMKEATGLARKIDSDLMVLRMDQSTSQAGFASSREGAKKGMFSLGAIVSKSLTLEGAYYDGQQQPAHNWLGAFKLPDGKWAYFAVRDANFLPNGDFAGTKEEVLERLHGDYGLGGWNVVVGDEELAEYGFHNFNAKRIEQLIPHKKDGSIRWYRWWALRQVRVKLTWKPFAAAGAVVMAAALAGGAYWKNYQRKQEELRREQAIEAARQEMQGKAPPAPVPRPWPSMPLPKLVVQACTDQFVHMTPGGWRLEEYVCTPTQATYTWSRQNSTAGLLLEQIPDAVVDMTGSSASYVERLDLGAGTSEALLSQKELMEPILSQMQLMGMVPQITVTQPVAQQPQGLSLQSPPPPPDWQTFPFSLHTRGIAPVDVAVVLERPGVRIEKLTYRDGEWLIDGVMYAK